MGGACRPKRYGTVTSGSTRRGKGAFHRAKQGICHHREQRGGNGAGKDEVDIVELQPGNDRLTESACSDERRERCHTDADN